MTTRAPSSILTAFAGKRRGRTFPDLFALYPAAAPWPGSTQRALDDVGLSLPMPKPKLSAPCGTCRPTGSSKPQPSPPKRPGPVPAFSFLMRLSVGR
jgi:hypothetical protein